jgi:CheY-like chemotaxis protein
MGGDSSLVRSVQPVNWLNPRIPRSVVCHVADKLAILAGKIRHRKNMMKVIETEFFPKNSDHELSPPVSIGDSSVKEKEKRRILIVDDDHGSTRLVKILLERAGNYVVSEENDSTKAHRSARNLRPHLILLDIMMPETDGAEIAEQIQADPELRRTPIIFLTALVTKAEARSGVRIQGYPFIAKPISIRELVDAIEEHLPARVKALG